MHHLSPRRYRALLRIRNAIIDRNIRLPEGTVIGFNAEEDRKRYHISDSGIVVVVPEERMFEEPE